MTPCPQARARLGAARHGGIMFWKEPPCRFRDFARRLRFLMPLALLVLSSSLIQAQTNDAVSREVSIFDSGPAPVTGVEAISREVSILDSGPAPVIGIEAISRE